MADTFTGLLKRQEQSIFMIRQRILFRKKAKCPSCRASIVMNYPGKSTRLCFFCPNCQLLFER